jgi:hypothetical protein
MNGWVRPRSVVAALILFAGVPAHAEDKCVGGCQGRGATCLGRCQDGDARCFERCNRDTSACWNRCGTLASSMKCRDEKGRERDCDPEPPVINRPRKPRE